MADDDAQSDYCEEEEEEDDEATLDEEEAIIVSEDDCEDELLQLQEEGELSLEELQRKYYGGEEEQQEVENATSDEVLLSSSISRTDGPSSSAIGDDVPSSAAHNAISLRDKIFSAIAGTCGQLSQTLGAYFHTDDLEEDDTEDYEPPEVLKKAVRIGDQFQINVPPQIIHQPTDDDLSELLWCPSPGRCTDALIDAYLADCAHIRAGEKLRRKQGMPDDEDALFALIKHNYEVRNAKESLLCSDGSSSIFDHANAPKQTQPPCPLTWSDDECEQFEKGMNTHYKCFWKIRRDYLPSRMVGELITFYYSWKKSERYDLWKAEKCQREQQVDAKTTDLMGRLTESLFHGESTAMDGEKRVPIKSNPQHKQQQQQQNGVGP